MGNSPRNGALILFLALSLPCGAEAQGFRLSGHVLRVDGVDTVAFADQWAVLHQVSVAGGGAIDSVRTGADGTYILQAPRRDTGAVYIASVAFRDIMYFTAPIRSVRFTTDTAETLFVFDTSSVAPDISIVQRSVVVRLPGEDGSRPVLELIVLMNRGTLTRIASDLDGPVWRQALPAGAIGLEVGDSDVSPEAITRLGDSLAVFAPLPPGAAAAKQIVVSYMLSNRSTKLDLLLDQDVDQLQILLEDTSATLESGALRRVGVEEVESRAFVRYVGTDIPRGHRVTLAFSGRVFRPGDSWWIVILVSMLAFGLALGIWWRRAPVTGDAVDHPDVLAARIAALDATFEARREGVSAAERDVYARQRAELKQRLADALAQGTGG